MATSSEKTSEKISEKGSHKISDTPDIKGDGKESATAAPPRDQIGRAHV